MKYVIKRYLNACSARVIDLSAKSGISLATLSRYLNGVRTPPRDGENIEKLAMGIFQLLEECTDNNRITQEEILEELRESIYTENPELTQELDVDNLNKLILEIGISKAAFAKKMHYSSSGISRILSKENRPRSVELFVDQVTDFVYENYNMRKSFRSLQVFIEQETGMYPRDIDAACDIIKNWLLGKIDSVNSDSDDLLGKIDEFDFEAYLSGIDLKDLERIPTTKLKLPVTRKYRGQKGLETGILDFLKATITSTSSQPIFLYSDHPIEHLSKDKETTDKWKKAIGAAIMRGKRIQTLHSFDRNDKEMLIGIENWIPIYMTGKVQSYYAEGGKNKLFSHVLMVSGSAVFSGFASGDTEGQYIFSKVNARISEGRKAADSLIAGADTLVEVYDNKREAEYRAFLMKDSLRKGRRIGYSDSLPVHTVSDSLLDELIADNNIDETDAVKVREFVERERKRVSAILNHSAMTEIVKVHGAHKVYDEKNSSVLRISEGINLRYTPNQYSEHMKLTEEFADNNKNYTLRETEKFAFSRLHISLHSGKHVIVIRNTGKTLNMMIKYPKIVDRIEDTLRNLEKTLPVRARDRKYKTGI